MSGFETRTNPAVVLRPGEVFVLDRQLSLASVTETVTVTGAAPDRRRRRATEPLPPVRQRPQTVPIPKVLLASVCGPDKPADLDVTVGHIVGHRDDPKRELFGPGDILLLDVGTEMGMAAGQNFVVRRRFRTGDKGAPLKQRHLWRAHRRPAPGGADHRGVRRSPWSSTPAASSWRATPSSRSTPSP